MFWDFNWTRFRDFSQFGFFMLKILVSCAFYFSAFYYFCWYHCLVFWFVPILIGTWKKCSLIWINSDIVCTHWYPFSKCSFVLVKIDDSDSDCMIKLNVTNFSIWKFRMKNYLYCRDLFELVLWDNSRPSDMSYEK